VLAAAAGLGLPVLVLAVLVVALAFGRKAISAGDVASLFSLPQVILLPLLLFLVLFPEPQSLRPLWTLKANLGSR
jgi:hypothetical protein